MHEPLVPMLFPILGAHMSGSGFQYPDHNWKEPTGMMANLVAESGGNKGQLSHLVEALCRDFRQHDEAELKKLVELLSTLSLRLTSIRIAPHVYTQTLSRLYVQPCPTNK